MKNKTFGTAIGVGALGTLFVASLLFGGVAQAALTANGLTSIRGRSTIKHGSGRWGLLQRSRAITMTIKTVGGIDPTKSLVSAQPR